MREDLLLKGYTGGVEKTTTDVIPNNTANKREMLRKKERNQTSNQININKNAQKDKKKSQQLVKVHFACLLFLTE